MKTLRQPYSVLLFAATTTVLLALGACGTSPLAAPTPAGAAAGRNTFIYIYSDHWPPWATMQPIVNGLEAEFRGSLAFEQRNAATDAGQATMQAYGLRGHPSYAIVKPDGKLLWSFSGPLDAERLRQQLMLQAGQPP